MTAPSVVLAEATWYGSFRAGISSSSGNTVLHSPGSRWGVKGSNEISDGLSGVYRYEEALDLKTATLAAGNRLSYVGLSGGFGTLTMGRVWGAEYNSTGAITDNSYFHGDSLGSYRVGPAVSYAISTGPVSMQIDAVMNDSPKTVDRALLGVSASFGSGKVAMSYEKNEFAGKSTSSGSTTTKATNTTVAGEFSFGSMRAYLGFATNKADLRSVDNTNTMDKNEREACQLTKCRATFAGIGGSLGDTGMGFLLQATQKRDAMGKPKPILLSLYRSLGGGSTVILEGVFNDKNNLGNKTDSLASLTLKVDF